MGRYDAAMTQYRRGMCLTPGDSDVHYNCANLYRAEDRLDEAVRSYRRAIACPPGNAELHRNLSLALPTAGRPKAGSDESAWRWKYDNVPTKSRAFPPPPLARRT